MDTKDKANDTINGLGGNENFQLDTSIATPVANNDNILPYEIFETINNFKQFVKEQKVFSSNVSRELTNPFEIVRADTALLNDVLLTVDKEQYKLQQQVNKLQCDNMKCLENINMAQHTNEIPLDRQLENVAPLKYFTELTNQFEQDMKELKVEIEIAYKHFQSLQNAHFLSSRDITNGMNRLHNTFVALAGRLHSVHGQVEVQKEKYLNLRKFILKDSTDVFAKSDKKAEEPMNISFDGESFKPVVGPTPFGSDESLQNMNMFSILQKSSSMKAQKPGSYKSMID